jgi:hypothetical protein
MPFGGYMKKSLGLLLLSVSPAVLCQSYSGSVGDLNTIFDPPMNINNIICSNTLNNGNEHDDTACADGVNAARWMAEKYAKNTGKYLGCLDGFYQGIWDGYQQGKNPSQEMMREADALVAGARFDSALSRAEAKAQVDAKTASADQIINRYRSVIGLKDSQGRNVLPNKSYEYPAITFNGFEDGYENDMKATLNFTPAINAGLVTNNSPFDDKVAARKSLLLQAENASSLCDLNQTVFGRRNMPAVTIWDFFKARREYDFQNYGWKNPDWAWEIFDRDERTLEQYQTFNRLNNLEKTVTETIALKETRNKLDAQGKAIPKLDAAGVQIVNAQGVPQFETEEVITGYKNETKRVKLSDSEILALKNLYINSFKTSYERYYAKQYVSQNYHSEGMEKYKTAQIIGKLIGEDVAAQVAKRESYNKQYKAQSAAKFAEKAKNLYKNSFDRLIGIFENNSVVELNDASLHGQVNDAIFRPGEELKMNFSISNLGEVSRPISMVLDNTQEVQSVGGGYIFNPPVLERQSYSTPTIGVVSSGLSARRDLTVGMGIVNPGDTAEVGRSMVVKKAQSIRLNDYAEVDKVSGGINAITGELNVVANIVNPSSIMSPSIADVELVLNGSSTVKRISIEQLGANSMKPVSFNINDIDPLALINTGRIGGTVSVKMAGRVTHKSTFEFTAQAAKDIMIVKYFDGLATKEVTNTGNDSLQDRISTIIGMIDDSIQAKIDNRIKWGKKVELSQTILPELQRVYEESKRQGTLNAEAQRQYDLLAETLAKNVKGLKARGILNNGKHRRAYLRELSYISQKVSLKPKSYN